MRVAQKFAGYSLAEADNLRKAMRQEDPRADGEGAGEVRRRRARPPATARARHRRCSTSSSSSPTTPSTSRTPSATASSPTRPPTSRRTTRPSTSPRCSQREGQPRQGGDLPHECRTMGIEVLVPDVNRSVSDFAPVVEVDADGSRERSIAFGLSAVRNVGRGPRRPAARRARGQRPLRRLLRLLRAGRLPGAQQADASSRSSRPAASTPSATPARACCACSSTIIDSTVARRRERDMGVMSPVRRGRRRRRRCSTSGPPIPDVEFDKRERLAFEKEMLGLYVSDHPLMGAEASLRRKYRRHPHRARRARRRRHAHLRRRGHRPAAQVDQEGRPHGRLRAGGPPDLRRGDGVPQDDDRPRPQAGRRRRRHRAGPGSTRRDDQPKLIAMDIELFEPMSGEALPAADQGGGRRPVRGAHRRAEGLLGEHPGDSPVFLHLGERRCCGCPTAWTVDVGPASWASSGCCSDPTRSSSDADLDPRVTTPEQVVRGLSSRCRVALERRVYWTSSGPNHE